MTSNTITDLPEAHEKPLAVTVKHACGLIDVGNTTMWGLIKSRRVETITVGRRRLVVFKSLQSLLDQSHDQ